MTLRVHLLILGIIFVLALFLRFYQLGINPAGLHGDGASQGYNAFSILHTGKDRYGETFPIIFRSNGSYQPPIYTYLTIIPVSIFGNTPFSARFISAFSGAILVLVTYLFVNKLFDSKKKHIVALISALVIALAPWSILFSRLTVEANLSVTIFSLGVLLLYLSIKKSYLFSIACLIMGIASHTYYSERITTILFISIFVYLFRKNFFHKENLFWTMVGLGIFVTTQIPHVIIAFTGAFSRRFDQVSYINTQLSNDNSIFTVINNLLSLFINNYISYFSPKNLFFEGDPSLGRTIPGLGVFYTWLIVPFFIGLKYLFKNLSSPLSKILLSLIIITPISAALTGDFFYPLRILCFLWTISIITSVGLYQLLSFIKFNIIKVLLSFILLSYSLFTLYSSYYSVSKYESAENFGYAYITLIDVLKNYPDQEIYIDSTRDQGVGIRTAYLKQYNPVKLQQQLRPQMKSPYYSSVVNSDETYNINNIINNFSWQYTCRKNILLVGDPITISDEQVKNHYLKKEFEIKNPLSRKISLIGYSTNPLVECPDKK
ncbi:MAG: glycosyltransferase family 39 protein [Candidatus Daviesbacteria bacterium]|nr:glycosyltransferase family 39 protein [Candidatus Daviesbacteria bacterium]